MVLIRRANRSSARGMTEQISPPPKDRKSISLLARRSTEQIAPPCEQQTGRNARRTTMVDPCSTAVMPSLKAFSLPHFAATDHSTSAISSPKSSLIVTEMGRNINNGLTSPST
ncbi:hypothetical protein LWI28_012352 [Acer negundo]|uniref:Uncharacterized protein n=1 Tax=Acer negundo TaxID=4023 RepID=A0AAD5IEL0_ACENE|nr:hypothetical protein LWI28_012352 [Acer negundo]